MRSSAAPLRLVVCAISMGLGGLGCSEDAPPALDPDDQARSLTVVRLFPTSGSAAGGTTVSIQGEGFAPDIEVRFGAAASPQVRFVDSRTVLADAPSSAPGMVDVTVRAGNRTIVLPQAFRCDDDDDDDDGHRRCRLVALAPSVGATDISVVSDIRLTYSERLSAAPAPADVHVRELGHDEIAVRTRLADYGNTLIITPEHSLHFWASYLVEVPGPRSHAGNVCDAAVGVFSTVVPSVPDRPLRPASINALARLGHDVVLASVSGYRGFQIMKLDSESRPTLLGDLIVPATPGALTVVGGTAFAAAGFDGVLVLDVSQPDAPTLATRFGTPGVAQALAPFDAGGRQYLAVGDGREGVRIFDVTKTLAPSEVAVLAPGPEGTEVRAVLVMNGHLVAATFLALGGEPSTFVVYDVADPARPVKLSESPTPYGVSALASSGAILYVALNFFGIDAFDMTDPTAPRFLSHTDGPHGLCRVSCRDPVLDMKVDDGRLWVALARSGAAAYFIDGAGGMVLNNVVPVAGNSQAVLPLGTRVLVGAEEGPLVYDANAGEGASPLFFDPRGHGVARSVVVSDDGFAYVAAAVRGVQTFAVTDDVGRLLDQPTYLGQTPTPSAIGPFDTRAGNVLLDGQRILVGDGRAGLAVLDRHDPRNPVLVGSLRPLDQLSALQLREDVLFACDDNAGLVVYDISVSSAPTEVARAQFLTDPHEACHDLLLAGDVLFMGGTVRLAAVDVSDPRHPVVRTEVTTPEEATFVSIAAIDATHVLALTADVDYEGRRNFISRLQVFDVSDPFDARWVSASQDLGGAGLSDGLAVRGDIAFVAARDAGVWIFDVSNPDAPLAEGLVAMPGAPRGVTPGDDRVFVAEQEGGLGVIKTGKLPGGH